MELIESIIEILFPVIVSHNFVYTTPHLSHNLLIGRPVGLKTMIDFTEPTDNIGRPVDVKNND
jgi:hypothetical protein